MQLIPKWYIKAISDIAISFKKFPTPTVDDCQKCALYRDAIVKYNVADIERANVYLKLFGDVGTRSEHKIAMADSLIQVLLRVIYAGYDVNELLMLGMKRMQEKSEDSKK